MIGFYFEQINNKMNNFNFSDKKVYSLLSLKT